MSRKHQAMSQRFTRHEEQKRERRRAVKAEEQERLREHARTVAAHPETKALFERAHKEAHVKGMQATAYGMTVTFQALHPAHVMAMLDALDTFKAEPQR